MKNIVFFYSFFIDSEQEMSIWMIFHVNSKVLTTSLTILWGRKVFMYIIRIICVVLVWILFNFQEFISKQKHYFFHSSWEICFISGHFKTHLTILVSLIVESHTVINTSEVAEICVLHCTSFFLIWDQLKTRTYIFFNIWSKEYDQIILENVKQNNRGVNTSIIQRKTDTNFVKPRRKLETFGVTGACNFCHFRNAYYQQMSTDDIYMIQLTKANHIMKRREFKYIVCMIF